MGEKYLYYSEWMIKINSSYYIYCDKYNQEIRVTLCCSPGSNSEIAWSELGDLDLIGTDKDYLYLKTITIEDPNLVLPLYIDQKLKVLLDKREEFKNYVKESFEFLRACIGMRHDRDDFQQCMKDIIDVEFDIQLIENQIKNLLN